MHFFEYCALFTMSVYIILVLDLCTWSMNKYNNNNALVTQILQNGEIGSFCYPEFGTEIRLATSGIWQIWYPVHYLLLYSKSWFDRNSPGIEHGVLKMNAWDTIMSWFLKANWRQELPILLFIYGIIIVMAIQNHSILNFLMLFTLGSIQFTILFL